MSDQEDAWIVPGKNRSLVKPRGADRRVKFGPARRRIFLEHMAGTCNVTASAAKAGVSLSAVYRCRMRDPDFREDWRDALEQGYAVLEAALLERAMRDGARTRISGDQPVEGEHSPGEIDWDKGMELLKHARRALSGQSSNTRVPRRVPPEVLAAKLIKRLKALGVRPDDGE